MTTSSKKSKEPKGFSKEAIKAMKKIKPKDGEIVEIKKNKDGSLKSITYGNKTFSQKGKPKRKDSHVKAYKKQLKSGSRKK